MSMYLKAMVCSGILVIGLAVSASADTIACLHTDYLAGTQGQTRVDVSADGWDYLFNPNGNTIGNRAGYESLKYNSSDVDHGGIAGAWDAYTCGGIIPGSPPYASYGSLYVKANAETGFGMTGPVASNYIILAYTVQPTEGGQISITNSSVGLWDTTNAAMDVRVYVDGTLKSSAVFTGSGTGNFDGSLGVVNVGQTIYVALGTTEYKGQGNIGGGFDFTLERTALPEPTSMAILATAVMGLLAYAWRKRR